MHILKEVCYMTASFPVIHSSHYFTWALEVIHISRDLFLFYNTCCNHPLQQAVRGWFEKKLTSTFIWGKSLYPCSFKGAYLFHRTSSNIFCLKSTLLNGQKHYRDPILSWWTSMAKLPSSFSKILKHNAELLRVNETKLTLRNTFILDIFCNSMWKGIKI